LQQGFGKHAAPTKSMTPAD